MLYIVAFWHLPDYFPGGGTQNPLTYSITYGVLATFTFISGYLLGTKKINNFKDIWIFYFLRLVSFYPLYFIACTLFLYIGHIENWYLWLMAIVGMAGIFSPAVLTLWYMCMLMLFYFITPLAIVIHDIKAKCMLIAFVFVVLLLLQDIAGIDNRYYFYWFFYGLGILLSGKTFKKVNYILLFLSIIIFLLICIKTGNEITSFSFISSSCFIFCIINLGKILEKSFLLPFLKKVSYASMCAYLFHRIVYWFIYCISVKYTGEFTVQSAYFVALPIMLLSAYAIQYMYDKIVKNKLCLLLTRGNN